MFRFALKAVRNIRPITITYSNASKIIKNDIRGFTTVNKNICQVSSGLNTGNLSTNKQILKVCNNIIAVPTRSVIKFSLNKGKRKTVKAVIKRFFRLHWGGWIRPKVARQKHLWKKSSARRRRLRQHVFCNATQNTLLDKMVTKFWKRPKYYVDDPYAPYHTREEFYITRKKPLIRK